MDFDGLPLIVGWELTLACNLRCRHCASAAGLPRQQELSLDECLDICDQFPDLLVQEVDFTGGEPLLRPDWAQIAGRLQRLGIWTQMVTNGLALAPDVIAKMKDTGIKAVGISLDGLPDTHDHIRGYPGLFRRVLTGMERVLAAGLPLCVITAVNRLNIDELPALLTLLQSVGVNHWQLQPLFPTGRAAGDSELELSDEVYMRLGSFVQEWLPRAKQANFKIDLADNFGYCTELDLRPGPWRGCVAGIVSCGITSDGKIKGCLSMPQELLEGDLRQHRLWDIWFRPGAFAYNRQFSPADLGPACQGCDMGDVCKGGCSTMSYGSTQRFHNDPYCFSSIRRRGMQPFSVCS